MGFGKHPANRSLHMSDAMTTISEVHSEDACYYGNRPDWLIVLSRHRDSGILANSNFESALEAMGGESECVAVEQSSHWAVGWVEYLIVNPVDSALVAQALHCA